MRFSRFVPLLTTVSLAGAAAAALVSCGSSGGGAGDALRGVLCGSGHVKGVMTAGVNLDLLATLTAPGGGSATTDKGLQSLLNSALGKVVDTKLLNVASVTSAVPGDSVRFLKLGGTYGTGFGVATSLIASAAKKSPSLKGVFKFLYEGYQVAATRTFDESAMSGFRAVSSPFGPMGGGVDGGFFAQTAASPEKRQWALEQTDYAGALKVFSNTTREVRVAVLDTGVDKDHPDLKDVLEQGYNAVDGSSRTDDDNGHGTHCAGVIAAQAKGSGAPLGVAARANVKIIPVKVLGGDGSGSSDAIEKGIRWAVKVAKADVISLSLGGGLEYTDAKREGGLDNAIIDDAIASGTIVVVAAGNESCPLGGKCEQPGILTSRKFNEYTVVPCAYKGTVCVGATDPDEKLASYSNYSSQKSASYRTRADVNAPGTKIYSTWPLDKGGPYKAISGTSMATPYVAGVAALLKANAKDPKDVNQEFVRSYLNKGLVYQSDVKNKTGTGRVDLYGTAYAFSKEYLQDPRTDLKSPPTAPNGVTTPDLPDAEGGGGLGAVGTVWDLLCAVSGKTVETESESQPLEVD